jgi:hypothetical protein
MLYETPTACGTGTQANKCDFKNPYFAQQLYYGEDFDNGYKFVSANKEAAFTEAVIGKNITFDAGTLNRWRCEIYAYKNPTLQSSVGCVQNVSETVKTATKTLYPWSHNYLKNVPTQKTLHFTLIFQVFVFMQVFNQINARKLFDGEFNVFGGIFRNSMFLVIVFLTIVMQVIMVQIGGKAVKTFPLDMEQNIICIVIGAGELIWGLLIKFVPVKFFACLNLKDEPLGPDVGGGVSTLMK